MAQFRGTIKGTKGEASRLGDKKDGLTITLSGWNLGVKVEAKHNAITSKDYFVISVTGGSNGSGCQEIATLKEGERKIPMVHNGYVSLLDLDERIRA